MNGASLMDEIGKITNPGKCKTVTGPCCGEPGLVVVQEMAAA